MKFDGCVRQELKAVGPRAKSGWRLAVSGEQ